MHRLIFPVLLLLAAIQPQRANAAWVASAAGYEHTCALDEGGNVSCWGGNSYGQLGTGDLSGHDTPIIVPGLSGVKALAAGGLYTCVVMQQDGSVRCWGYNYSGQLGLGTTVGTTIPTPVAGLAGVVAISAGDSHTCAATASGATYCWGLNNFGQLGLGGTSDRLVPTIVPTLTAVGIQSLAAGNRHTCAVTSQGGVMCWGLNDSGQLGVGDNADRKVPTAVIGLANGSGATVVDAGASHTCALKSSNKLMCWGDNDYGQLGQGTIADSSVPQQVLSVSGGVVRVATGSYHTCALLGSYLYCWGLNSAGQLGVGDNERRFAPANILGWYPGVLGMTGGDAHTCLVKADGNLACWGDNGWGELGLGLLTYRSSALPVRELSASVTAGATAIAVGDGHACALKDGGGAVCWGSNGSGQLGIGSHSDRAAPMTMPSLQDPVAVAAGSNFSCALVQSGGVNCWGYNYEGQLGNDSHSSESTPVAVKGLGDASALAAGYAHACAIRQNGSVSCWGANDRGQLGRGTTTDSQPTAAGVSNFFGPVSKLAAGGSHTCAVTAATTVFCWGRNDDGQLGIGTAADQSNPVQVPALADVASVAAGGSHTCVAKTDGSVWCWGDNQDGELGLGDLSGQHWAPTQVPGLSDVVQVTAGASHTCARKTSGAIVCWGYNYYGQLGLDDRSSHAAPVPVPNVAAAIAVSAGSDSTCALKSDKSVMCWGDNYYGQLGSGTLGYVRRPRELDHILEDGFDPMVIP